MSTETEIELGKVVAFPNKNNDLQDGLVIQREGQKVMCLHSTVWVNEKDRTLRCRKCETLIEPFDFLMTLCDQESRYMESVKYLRREEKQRRQNIEKLIRFEHQVAITQWAWAEFREQLGAKKVAVKTMERLKNLIWLAAQDVKAELSGLDTYEYQKLAELVGVTAKNWSETFTDRWVGMRYIYRCLDSVGVWTIGYGWTQPVDGKLIRSGMSIKQETAERLLKTGLVSYESDVSRLVKVALTQGQFDALVSFTYNLGARSLSTSTLLRKLNAGDYSGAADEFLRWNKAGGKVLNGLTRRREAERALFLS